MKPWILISLFVASMTMSCGSNSEQCTTADDCDLGQKCQSGKCVVLCSCLDEDECTATAPECAVDAIETDVEEEVFVCLELCTFKSQCDDGNQCTKDDCLDGCCSHVVYSPEEAVGCCLEVADCRDHNNDLASDENPDGDPCTVDYCTEEFHCEYVMEDPFCCRKPSDCTDENFCTTDTCLDNTCIFGPVREDCCNFDSECNDDLLCTMDICIAGVCAHPQDNLNPSCVCTGSDHCDDGNECTVDSCLDGKCTYDISIGTNCCSDNAGCDDQDDTTVDYCKMYTCVHEKLKTCISDSTCADLDACTIDVCEDGYCMHPHSDDPYCCNKNEDCDDKNDCTEGHCAENVCQYQILDNPGCCKSATECDDGIGCTIDECNGWVCGYVPVGANCCTPETAEQVCSDGNPCTLEQCVDGLCDWQMMSGGCCEVNDDCLDCVNSQTGESCPADHSTNPPTCPGENCESNICTIHVCSNQFCYYTAQMGCCLSDLDCVDSNPCTADTCQNSECHNDLQPGCCANSGMCNDGEICTIDICEIPAGSDQGTCTYSEKPDCCNTPDDCPTIPCKNTYCQNGNCVHVDKDNCCVHNQECNDNDFCTIDQCIENSCVHTPSGAEGCD